MFIMQWYDHGTRMGEMMDNNTYMTTANKNSYKRKLQTMCSLITEERALNDHSAWSLLRARRSEPV